MDCFGIKVPRNDVLTVNALFRETLPQQKAFIAVYGQFSYLATLTLFILPVVRFRKK